MGAANLLKSLFGWGSATPQLVVKDRGDNEISMSNPYGSYSNYVKPPLERRRLYDVYDDMDEMDIISSVLDAYAEDATQVDREHKKTVWVTTSEGKVKTILEDMFERLRIEDNIEAITRDVAKYGDDFAQLYYEKDTGISGWDWKDPRDIERMENNRGVLLGFEDSSKLDGVAATITQGKAPEFTYKPWDMIHFRLYKRKRVGKQKYRNLYGTSVLAGATRIAKQVKILDDMLMVHRLTQSLDRRQYNVDVANANVEEEIQILKRWKRALKRNPYIDPAAGRYDSTFDPFSFSEDIFWPVRTDSNSSSEIISGQGNVSDIVDVEMFISRLFGALRAPKGYFGFEGDVDSKGTLSSQDMKWGRSVNSLQRAVKNGLYRLCQIELALHGIDPVGLEFAVEMVVPSVLEELSRLEAMQTMIDMAERLASLGETLTLDEAEWKFYIMRSILGFTDEEIVKYGGTSGDIDAEPSDGKDDKDNDTDNDDRESSGVAQLDETIGQLIRARMRISPATEITEFARREELPIQGQTSDQGIIHQFELVDDDPRSEDSSNEVSS